jgi:adenylate cyclase
MPRHLDRADHCSRPKAATGMDMELLRSLYSRSKNILPAIVVVVLLAGLPTAVWLDLRSLSEAVLQRQASDLSSAISSIRSYYATNIVGRVLSFAGPTMVVPNYKEVSGAIPIPATLSLELGRIISEQQSNIAYRFISDYPFKNRDPHPFDAFESQALAALRQRPNQQVTELTAAASSLMYERVRQITPIIMEPACVSCHNTHPDSPKRDWKVGDVRGIQELSLTQPIAVNISSFKYSLAYFWLAGISGIGFLATQWRQAAVIRNMNHELEAKNRFLATISSKISRYLSPQVYKSIFTGQTEATIHTERKKLTIFFSDIKDFTASTERLQPEEVTLLLNEYFTEMSDIALRHGGTVDKFIGDAILIFFGDPETKGTAEDAKACLGMAIEMQERVAALNAKWRKQGIEQPFRVRMGINTGFCNVGNFGSADRMTYTIIGAEANLAARLQSMAEPGQIVISYETYALVTDIVVAHPLPPLAMKGITRDIVPYAVDGTITMSGRVNRTFSEHTQGVDFYLDPRAIDPQSAARIRRVLQSAVEILEERAHQSETGISDDDTPRPG